MPFSAECILQGKLFMVLQNLSEFLISFFFFFLLFPSSLAFEILINLYISLHLAFEWFQVIHGAEKGETAALLLSPLRPAFKDPSSADTTQYGSQFTFFLTAPLQAFCQMVGISSSDANVVSQ